MKPSAQDNILAFLRREYPRVFPSGELQRMEFRNKDTTTASPAIISRRLRDLEMDKKIAVRYGNKDHAEYRYLQEHERFNYIPTSERSDPAKCWHDTSLVKELKYKVEYVFDGSIMRETKIY